MEIMLEVKAILNKAKDEFTKSYKKASVKLYNNCYNAVYKVTFAFGYAIGFMYAIAKRVLVALTKEID